MARSTSRRRSSCATVTPPRTGRRAVRPRRDDRPDTGTRTDRVPDSLPPPARLRRAARRASHVRTGRRRQTVGWRLGWAGRRPVHAGQRAEVGSLIFKAVRDGKPYPDHGLSTRDWAMIPPRQVRMDELDDHEEGTGARRPAGRGLDVLRRPVPARRAVARRAVPRGRPAPRAAGRAAAAQRPPRAGARPTTPAAAPTT